MAIRKSTGISSFKPIPRIPVEQPTIYPARVVFTLHNNTTNPELFEEMGGYASIGCIKFRIMDDKVRNRPIKNYPTAIPLFPNVKNYPLKFEIVYILALPNSSVNVKRNSTSFYYFNPINLWNSSNHNAIKLPEDYNSTTLLSSYGLNEQGLENEESSEPEDINLGETFRENSKIRPTQTYEGDIIYEGRFGQSLRLGSTVNTLPNNPWSSQGENGDPIITLKTSQTVSDTDSWIPYIENINTDQSSIYLTSTQNVPIEVSSKNYNSFENSFEPIPPETFAGEQIILNSGRLLLNSKTDNILLSSNDSINFNAQETVNIDAVEGFIVDSPEVLLGSKDATEPIILGDKFLDDIEDLAQVLLSLGNNLELNPMLITPASPNASLVTIGGSLRQKSKRILDNIERYKSKVSFSK